MANWNRRSRKYYLLVYLIVNCTIKSSRENRILTISSILPLILRILHLNLGVTISKTLIKQDCRLGSTLKYAILKKTGLTRTIRTIISHGI